MDSAELGEWMAYERIAPFGDMAADRRHGIATAALANINRDPKRRPDAYVANDFIPWEAVERRDEPELLSDPEAHARLIKQKLFKSG